MKKNNIVYELGIAPDLIYNRAWNLFKDEETEVSDDTIKITPYQDSNSCEVEFFAFTYGSKNNIYDQNMRLHFENNKFHSFKGECDCPYARTHDICKHKVSALLTYINKYTKEGYLEDNSNENIDENIKKYENKNYQDTENVIDLFDLVSDIEQDNIFDEQYELIPIFDFRLNNILLTLKIGQINGKSYVVKNFETLYLAFLKNNELEYGKIVIEHNKKKFKNKEILNYILKIIHKKILLIQEVENHSYNYIKYSKKDLILDQDNLEYLLNNIKDTVIIKDYQGEIKYKIIESQNKINFKTIYENDQVKIKADFFKVVQIKETLYILDSQKKEILKIKYPKEKYASIISTMILEDTIINQENIYNFKYSILNRIKDYVNINFKYELNTDKYELASLITTLELKKDNLYITHSYFCQNNKLKPVFNHEKLNKLLNTTKIYAKEFSKEDKEHQISGVVNIMKYMQNGFKKTVAYSDEIKTNLEFDNFEVYDEIDMNINISISGSSLLFDLGSSNFSDSELLEILKRLKSDQKYYQLKNKKYVSLDDEKFLKLEQLAQKLNVDLSELSQASFKVSSYNALYLDILLNDMNLKNYKEKKLVKMIEQVKDFKNQELKISKNVDAKLRDYQQVGVNWLNTLRHYNLNGILADDMGLGKTLQIIALLSSIKQNGINLIITPAALVYNWKNEFAKFNPTMDIKVISGDPATREKLIRGLSKEIVITSYDLLKRDINKYKEHEFEYIILDEGQNIKNARSQITKAIKLLKAKHHLVLTGTPIENNLTELWSIFDFLMPNYLYTNKQFKTEYEAPIIKNQNKEVLKTLQNKVKPFILRRVKEDVLKELPKKIEKVVYMEMETTQKKVYDAQVLEVKKILAASTDYEFNKNKIQILSLITKMRQIVCNPCLVFDEYSGGVIKTEFLIDNLLELKSSNHKTLIFSQFVSNFKMLEREFDKNNISFYKITGATPKDKRHLLVESFNQDDTDVFLISLKAGGTGLNIIGADTVIHLDPWWNTAVQNQATDRAYRMGQTKNVLVYKYICKDTIEEKILEIQNSKKKLMNNILEGDNMAIAKMDKQDFLNLFD